MKIGDSAEFSKTISESDVYMFAGITGDFNPINVNSEYAKNSIFSNRIVHGMLTSSLISTILGTKMPGEGTIFLEQNVKFKKPVYIGDTVRAEIVLSEVINYEKGIIKFEDKIFNHDKQVVIEGYSIVKIDKEKIER